MLDLNDTKTHLVPPVCLHNYMVGERDCRIYGRHHNYEIWILREGVLCGKLRFTDYVEPGEYCAVVFTPDDGLLYRIWEPESHADKDDFRVACMVAMANYGDMPRETTRCWEGLCTVDVVDPQLIVLKIDDVDIIAFTCADTQYRLIDLDPHRHWHYKPASDDMLGDSLDKTIDVLMECLSTYLHTLLPDVAVILH